MFKIPCRNKSEVRLVAGIIQLNFPDERLDFLDIRRQEEKDNPNDKELLTEPTSSANINLTEENTKHTTA